MSTRLLVSVLILMFLLGTAFGVMIQILWEIHHRPQTNSVKHTPCGYTAISYDSVLWSDGGRTKYNWHTKKGGDIRQPVDRRW